ncbi:hypothetical protein [Microbulbifer rhizosphaerae]|uniref:Uncharacterized protein n=1 Tax=Microbulbifer rhizosphaerae TaxID=1562603 RepID=A0A7W4ZA65_9GAMM|nr:hypothetical protein [Microbulbifer rhizosphaerae]MBB3062427.1 hypothetical protein [Microbulbifer rhizosphaerae]
MPWLPGDIWDYGDEIANQRLRKIRKFDAPISVIPVLETLVDWRRNDLARDLLLNLPPTTRERILFTNRGIFGVADQHNVVKEPVTIGRRKGNQENIGEYEQGPTPTGLNASLYLPSLKAFLRGSMGHVYTGILVCPGAFNVMKGEVRNPNLALPEQREREMIFLAANDPPSAAEQEADSIAEPYLNRSFTTAEVAGHSGQVRGRTQPGSSGYQSWNPATQTMNLNQNAIVHGRANNGNMDPNDPRLRAADEQSHAQLRRMIVASNRYQGIIPDIQRPDGEGMFIGFTVMKGGRDTDGKILNNVYGWTSNSMNKNAFQTPTGNYLARLKAQEKAITDQIASAQGEEYDRLLRKLLSLKGRNRAQVSLEYAQIIKKALDRLLDLQMKDNTNDPYFRSIINQWGPYI